MKKTTIRTVTVSAFMLALLASPSFAKTTVKNEKIVSPAENRVIVKTTTTTVETFDDKDKKKKEEFKHHKDDRRHDPKIKKEDYKKFEPKKYDGKKTDLRRPLPPCRKGEKVMHRPEVKKTSSAGELLAAGIVGALITGAVISASN